MDGQTTVGVTGAAERRGRRLAMGIAGLAFLLSGAAALIYQVAWQRILALHTGVGIYSIAVIVAAFMAGLGLGSHLGGRLSTRLPARRALGAFAGVELMLAAFGAASGPLYYDVLYVKGAWLYSRSLPAALMHFASLALPTILMGMSLPLLVRATVREAASAPRTIGYLYGINALGASVGALLTPWLLVRLYGLQGALYVAAACNALAGLGALALLRSVREAGLEPPAAARALPPAESGPSRFGLWVALYALGGFLALSLEIVWFRIIDVAVKSTSFTFGTILAVYLLGLAAGSLVGSLRAERVRRPLRVFLALQCLILAWAGLTAAALVRLPPDLPVLSWLVEQWRHTEPAPIGAGDWARVVALYLGLPALLCGPPTVLMGYSFTVLQRAVQDAARTSGLKVGILQAANIAGCVAGSLLVGLLLLGWLGSSGTLRVLVAAGVGLAALGLWLGGERRLFAALSAGLLLVLALSPGQEALWHRLHGVDEGQGVFAEDATSVSGASFRGASTWVILVNGKGQSVVPYGGDHTLLGAVPAVIHPAPVDVAVIGLGSGNTAWAAGCRPETRTLTVFEIAGSQDEVLHRLDRRINDRKLAAFLRDPRKRLVVADGRNALEREQRLYDFIEADALRPSSAYSGNLYSREFFERCARRLKKGGLMCSWAPTPRVTATFRSVFPHVVFFEQGAILVGSLEPIALEPQAWRERARSQEVVDYLGQGLARLVQRALMRPAPVAPDFRLAPNRDLFPRDEFQAPFGDGGH